MQTKFLVRRIYSLGKTNWQCIREIGCTVKMYALFHSSDCCKTYFRYLNSCHWCKTGKSITERETFTGQWPLCMAGPFLNTRILPAGTESSGWSFFTNNGKPEAVLMHSLRFLQADLKLRSHWVPITFSSLMVTHTCFADSWESGWLKLGIAGLLWGLPAASVSSALQVQVGGMRELPGAPSSGAWEGFPGLQPVSAAAPCAAPSAGGSPVPALLWALGLSLGPPLASLKLSNTSGFKVS